MWEKVTSLKYFVFYSPKWNFRSEEAIEELKNATGTITFVAESRSRIRLQDFRNSESEPTKKDLAPHITGGGSSYARQ